MRTRIKYVSLALFILTFFLSACAHTSKTARNENFSFSFLGNTMPCKDKSTDETSVYICKNKKLYAAFFDTASETRKGYALFPTPEKAVEIIVDSLPKKAKFEKETYTCPDGKTYVTAIKEFGKGKKSAQIVDEILVHNTVSAMMFIEHRITKKDTFSILEPESVNDLCTRFIFENQN